MAAKMPPSEDQAPDSNDEDALVVPEGFHDQPAAPSAGRDRRGLATDVDLDPMSLSGSYFHRVENGEVVWGGVVVGEVQAGKYLCQIDKGLEGADRVKVQVIIPIEQMLAKDPGYEFRFYDRQEDQTLAYATFLANQEQEA